LFDAHDQVESGAAKLRFAVLCDGLSLERWQAAALRLLIAEGRATLAAVLFFGDDAQAKRASAAGLPTLFQPSERAVDCTIDEMLAATTSAAPHVATSDDDLAALRLDFILYLGFGAADARSAAHARLGMWRFRFGAADKQEIYPPGVWEVVDGDPVTVASLCRLDAGSIVATVLRTGAFATITHVPNANADQMFREAALWPAYAVRLAAQGLAPVDAETIVWPDTAIARRPGAGLLLRLIWTMFWQKMWRLPNLFFDDSWNVAIVDAPIHSFLAGSADVSASWFPNQDAGTYLADPMGAVSGDDAVVLCESYDFKSEIGSIVKLGWDGNAWQPSVVPAIPSRFHSSYPYLFEADGRIYCVPESNQAEEIALFEATEGAAAFRRVRTLLTGVRYVDPTIFRHDGLWWLFCSDTMLGEHTHLLAFFAADLAAEWRPHPLNPLKIDVRSARPAGTPFVHEVRLYRPSQNCAKTYGGGVTICEITRLSATEFAEVPVAELQPLRSSVYRSGFHTLSRFGERTLIDGKRRIFTANGLKEKLSSVMRRFTAR
jgi:hypothetical protein